MASAEVATRLRSAGVRFSVRPIRNLAFVSALAVAAVGTPSYAAPVLGGDPIHTEDDVFAADGWQVAVFSYVFDSTSTSLPPGLGLVLDADEMLFVYVLDGDDTKAVSVDTFTVGNPVPVPIKSIGWDDDVVPGGFDASDFQSPFGFGYSQASQSTVYSYMITTLDPDEYSVVYYLAEAGDFGPVNASISGAGIADTQLVAGPTALVPEPHTLVLLAMGSIATLGRTRRRGIR